jgi:ribosomal-protein-alanine N-acetyltransferase
MSVLESERLLLRPFCEDDLDDLFTLQSDPDVMRYLGTGKARTREETQERLQRVIGHWEEHGFGMWALVVKDDGRFAGWCGFGYGHGLGDAELSYTLARRYWGQGLATEAVRRVLRYAFEQVVLPRVVGVARIENTASQRVMLRVGMTLRQNIQYDDKEALMYAIENPILAKQEQEE